MNRKIYLSLLGDINNPLEWSGTGYYCLENFKKQPLARAYRINSYERLISNLKNLYF